MEALSIKKKSNSTHEISFIMQINICNSITDVGCESNDTKKLEKFFKSFYIMPFHKQMSINFEIYDSEPMIATQKISSVV